MGTPDVWVAGVILVALMVYMITGGADFGGGFWDLFASGPRADAQRTLIAKAIGPVWEANHVWLIVVIVLLFVCFPTGFAAIATALHIPLTLMLFGIVLRGAAFIFRTYDAHDDRIQQRWGRLFAMASILSPVMLGVCAGTVASGAIRLEPGAGTLVTGFFSWLGLFPFLVGGLTLALGAFLAAVYLANEATDGGLQEDFRLRALLSAAGVGVMAGLALLVAHSEAPRLAVGLAGHGWSLGFQLVTGAAAVGAIASLWLRRFRLARLMAVTQTGLILLGWGVIQLPFLIVPDLTFAQAAAPEGVLRTTLKILAAGSVLLIPSFWYLYAVFKRSAFQSPE